MIDYFLEEISISAATSLLKEQEERAGRELEKWIVHLTPTDFHGFL